MNRRGFCLLALTGALTLTGCAVSPGYNWPQWRGPDGNSLSVETRLPTQWGENRNVVWKREIPGWGRSTPTIWGDAIFLTTHHEEDLLLLRIDKRTGEVVWKRQVGHGEVSGLDPYLKTDDSRRRQVFHRSHNLATPSPVTDGERVVVHFGNGDLASYTFDGKREWHRNLQEDHGTYTIWWGHANSPVLFESLVISVCIQDSLEDLDGEPSESYVVAHDKRTGAERWRTLRMTGATAEPCDAYTTPVLYRGEDGWEVIVWGGTQLDAYDPRSGEQLWYLKDLGGNRTITGPTVANGLVYVTLGMKGALLAVKLGDRGTLSSGAIVWKHEKGTPDSPCQAVWRDRLFMVNNTGIATCLDAKTGAQHWTERLGREYRSSPLVAAGHAYFLSTEGDCAVVKASPEFRLVSRNTLEDEFLASPAVSDGQIFLRGKSALYCVGQPN